MITEVMTAFGSLLFVIGLLGLFAWAIRRFGLIPGQSAVKSGTKQIEVLESKMLDGRNRLMAVSWRGKQFLLATNPSGTRVIAAEDETSTQEFKELLSDDENN
jgi:flagellar biogenesis protein FliO